RRRWSCGRRGVGVVSDPWAPPQWVQPTPAPPSRRGRRVAAAWLAGALAVVLVAAVAVLALHRSHAADPRAVVRDYVAAAQRGDAESMLRLTAPSQRAGVHVSTL